MTQRRGRPKRADDRFYGSSAWQILRKLALERDGYRCTRCKADVSGPGKSRVDHIKPRRTHPHLALALSNLRTLCTACDGDSHRERGQPGGTGERIEQIRGFDLNTMRPLDPNHHWNQEKCEYPKNAAAHRKPTSSQGKPTSR